MPPKKSSAAGFNDVHHITFHFYKAAVFLSVSASTTVTELKSQIVTAISVPSMRSTLTPHAPHLPEVIGEDDFRIYESLEDTATEGQEVVVDGYRSIEGDKKEMSRNVRALGWGRWKRLFLSFKNADGGFEDPVATIPDVEDEGEESL